MQSFRDKIVHHFDKQLPFVVYRKPNEDDIIGIFQNIHFALNC